jgi:hypothetical protein
MISRMILTTFSATEGFEGVDTGVDGFSDFSSSFGTLTDSVKLAPQYLQNLSVGLTFFPQFGQYFAIVLYYL